MNALIRSLSAFGTAVALAGVGLGPARAESCPPQCASGKVPLGVSLPVSGPMTAFGRQTAKAVEVAVRELNAGGGLMGVPVAVVVGDDRCDAGMAVSVARRHVEQDKVSFVIGPTCPPVAIDAAPVYAKAGVIQFLPTVTLVGLTRRYPDTLFRMVANDEQEAQALGAYLARAPKGKRVAVVYGDVFYRRAMAETARLNLPDDMKPTARFEPLADVTGAYDRLADKLRRDPPDVIYMVLDAEPVVEFVRKLHERRIKSVLIGGQHLLSQSFWLLARKDAEGILVVAPIGSLNDPDFRRAVDLLRQAEVVPDLVALNSYAAVQTWAEAVRRAGAGDPKKVAEALRAGEFKTAVGSLAFQRNGDRRDIHYSVLTWQGGRLIPGVEWSQ